MGIPVLAVLEYMDAFNPLKACAFYVVGTVINESTYHPIASAEVLQHVLLRITAVIYASRNKDDIEWDIPLAKPVEGFSEPV